MISICQARKEDASVIARLIIEAMTVECCEHFYGARFTIDDFAVFMESLVRRENTQYSYVNTAVAKNEHNEVIGAVVSYNGADLHRLREPFLQGMRQHFQRDIQNIPDETQAGELYIDSLAVNPAYRKMGIGTQLLQSTFQKARDLKINCVGLLVDYNNEKAAQLYTALGFQPVNDASWGGHPMKHLQINV